VSYNETPSPQLNPETTRRFCLPGRENRTATATAIKAALQRYAHNAEANPTPFLVGETRQLLPASRGQWASSRSAEPILIIICGTDALWRVKVPKSDRALK